MPHLKGDRNVSKGGPKGDLILNTNTRPKRDITLDHNINMSNGQQRSGFHNYYLHNSIEKREKLGQKLKDKTTKRCSGGPYRDKVQVPKRSGRVRQSPRVL